MKPWIGVVVALVLVASACTTSVFSLEVGNCIADPGNGQVDTVDIVDCDDEHDYEIYANLTVPESVGLAGVENFALEGCYDAFPDYVGTDFESSVYDFTWFEPTTDSWEQRNDRTVNCLLFDFQAGTSTGSARGSAR